MEPDHYTKAAENFITSAEATATEHCVGNRWEAHDIDRLAELVAYIAKGQAIHAQDIISGLNGTTPAVDKEWKKECIDYLTVPKDENGEEKRGPKKWHRDGFLFEAISWIVARQFYPPYALLKDPHVNSTTSGLDGLMIVLNQETHSPVITTIFEDKCKEDARAAFRDEILPCFKKFNIGKGKRGLQESVGTLIRQASIPNDRKAQAAGEALRQDIRSYRASLVIDSQSDNDSTRSRIFSGYEEVEGLSPEKRVAATFVIPFELREWFEVFAILVIEKL